MPREAPAKNLQRDLELGRDGKLTPAAFAARADAAEAASLVGSRLWEFWGAATTEGGRGDLRCYPAQASNRRNASEWPGLADPMAKVLAEALGTDPGSPSAAYYLACLTYNQWKPDSDPSGQAIRDALAILDRPQIRDKTTPAIVALRAELVGIRDSRASYANASKEFDKLVAKLSRGKASRRSSSRNRGAGEPKLLQGAPCSGDGEGSRPRDPHRGHQPAMSV
jgi:hypothetical protein